MTNRVTCLWRASGAFTAVLAVACVKPGPTTSAAGWHPRAAARYLDARQDWWVSWKSAARDHGTFCVSCHTVLPYALARSSLRTALSSNEIPVQEKRLLDDVKRRTDLWT